MIRTIDIKLNAAHPQLPILEATTFVGSPSAVMIHGVPPSVGAWRINAVRVVATYPDNSAHTVAAVLGAAGTWVATIPATDTSGRVAQGLQIIADGTDERGESVTGYVLGIAGLAVYSRDMTIESATGVKYYIHLLDAEPAEPKEGDAYLDGTALNIYHDGEWIEIAGGGYEPPPGGIPKTDLSAGVQASLDKADSALQTAPVTRVNGKTGAVSLTASDVGALPLAGGTMTGDFRLNGSSNGTNALWLWAGDWIGFVGSNGVYLLQAARGRQASLNDIVDAANGVLTKWVSITTDSNTTIGPHNVKLLIQTANGDRQLGFGLDGAGGYFVDSEGDNKQYFTLLAPLDSPAFTGTPTAPTPASGDDSAKVATTAFVQNAIGGITPGPDNTKLDATSAASAFSTSSTYAVDEHCTYNGKLYRCTTAVTVAGEWNAANWTADTMTDPDAVLDITSQSQLRVVAKDGTLLWAQGYDLASTSSATLACDAVNNFTFADGATSQAFALPTAPTGKVGDFILDIDNSANTGAATMTLTGLDTTFSVVVQEGESLTDMLAIAAGELARFYITLTSFRVNNLPTWHIVKQVVENGGAQS